MQLIAFRIMFRKKREVLLTLATVTFMIISAGILGTNNRSTTPRQGIKKGGQGLKLETKVEAATPPAPASALIPRSLANCTNRPPKRLTSIRGNFTIVTNFVIAERKINCRKFVTYTTHGDFRYLDNLVPLIERWVAPVSIALYTPASDLQATLYRIAYLRECTTPLVKKWVTFHLFSETDIFKDPLPFLGQLEKHNQKSGICDDIPEFSSSLITKTTRKKNRIYPINLARNVARQEAPTHFILASDIELYPSIDFNRKFVDLLNRGELALKYFKYKYVFVLPIFEVNSNKTEIPNTKTDLLLLLIERKARTFHFDVCQVCHQIPKYVDWVRNVKIEKDDKLNVFHVAKRLGPYRNWEPIYVGTNEDPLYDESLSWEGLSDKMVQAYTLCLLDYNFFILDTAFLVHRYNPVKDLKNILKAHTPIFKNKNELVQAKLKNQLVRIHGYRPNCDRRYGIEKNKSRNWNFYTGGKAIQQNINRSKDTKSKSNCTSGHQKRHKIERNNFTIWTNFVTARRRFNCREFVTWTTHGDFSTLHNLVSLVERWLAPVSIAVFSESINLQATINHIHYIRECTSLAIKDWVTFHLISDLKTKTEPPAAMKSDNSENICDHLTKVSENIWIVNLTNSLEKISYPLNLLKNVARTEALTHLILASDMDFVPSLDFNTQFLSMIYKYRHFLKKRKTPFVFVIPTYEIKTTLGLTTVPNTYEELENLLKANLAAPYHKILMSNSIINELVQNVSNANRRSVRISGAVKRGKGFSSREPIFVGSKDDPGYFDAPKEEFYPKVSQVLMMCLLGYDFMVLDYAFLIYRPGATRNFVEISKNVEKMPIQIQNKWRKLYRNKPECGYKKSSINNSYHQNLENIEVS